MPRKPTADELARLNDAIASGQAIVCYSRCICCGRRTANEACRECAALNFACNSDRDHWKKRFHMEPESER